MNQYLRCTSLVFCLFFLSFSLFAQESKDISTVKSMLFRQQADWNQGNINAFMNGYWQSDKLKFIGASGVTYGYQPTLENYHKRYPNKAAMGKLKFQVVSAEKLSIKVILLVGKWDLDREIGDIGGIFTLLFKKMLRPFIK